MFFWTRKQASASATTTTENFKSSGFDMDDKMNKNNPKIDSLSHHETCMMCHRQPTPGQHGVKGRTNTACLPIWSGPCFEQVV